MENHGWASNINWHDKMDAILGQLDKPGHKYGFKQSCAVIDYLCAHKKVSQADLKEVFGLTMDGIMTILSNVTIAIQGLGNGKVREPEHGGWYAATSTDPYSYTISPGFVAAWTTVMKP